MGRPDERGSNRGDREQRQAPPKRGTHHSIQEVEGPQSDGLVLVVQTLQNKVFVGLHRLGVRP